MAFIEFKDVTKTYTAGQISVTALRGASFSIEKGEICVIVGESGAGKTTLLNILGGMDALSSGSILLDGKEISGFSSRQLTAYRRHDIGFVFQFYNLIQNLTALENVELSSLWTPPKPLPTWGWRNGCIIFPQGFPAENNSGWPLPGRWQKIQNCFCAMNRPAL